MIKEVLERLPSADSPKDSYSIRIRRNLIKAVKLASRRTGLSQARIIEALIEVGLPEEVKESKRS
jgi:predicted XRE-type DNA-binding protein